MSRGFANAHLCSKGKVAEVTPLYDCATHGAAAFRAMCSKRGPTLTVIVTKECGELCGITSLSFENITAARVGDAEAVLFDNMGPHFPTVGATITVWHVPSNGPCWGGSGDGCLSTGLCLSTVGWGGAYTGPSPSYPTWSLQCNPLTVTRVTVYRIIDLCAPCAAKDLEIAVLRQTLADTDAVLKLKDAAIMALKRERDEVKTKLTDAAKENAELKAALLLRVVL